MELRRSRKATLLLAAMVASLILASATWRAVAAAPRNPGGRQIGAQAAEANPGAPEANTGFADVFPAADRSLLQTLSKAQQLVEQQRYAEAVQSLGAILEAPEDAFLRPSGQTQLFPGLKAEAQAIVGRLPKQGREFYELQFGARARSLLATAAAAGDAAGLAEVSRRYFHTRAGYEATFLLGGYQWNHGSPLAGALTLKRLRELSPIADQFEPELSLTLAACWQSAGAPEKALAVVNEVKKRHPEALVQIGGKESRLSKAVIPLINAAKTGPAGPDFNQWHLVRGEPTRNGSVPASGPLLSACWRIPTTDQPYVESLIDQIQQSNRDQDRWAIPALQPLVVRNVVLMRTARNLLAVDFQTGKRIWEVPGDDPFETVADTTSGNEMMQFGGGGPAAFDLQAALRFRLWGDTTFGTLSSDGDRVFAVEDLTLDLGMWAARNAFIPNRRGYPTDAKPFNRLAAYDVRTGKLVWHLGGTSDDAGSTPSGGIATGRLAQAGTFFLGPPLPVAGQLHVICEQKGDIRLLVLDARTGNVLWTQQLAVVDEDRDITDDPLRRVSGVSPSSADGILVCPTSNKSVVALEPATRTLLWGYIYKASDASQARQPQVLFAGPPPTDPEPANRWADSAVVLAEGRVLLTPIDSGELHCLNLLDGKALWRKARHDSLYLACVYRDKVVLVGRYGVRALALSDGEVAWERKFDNSAMPSGTGFLSDGHYYVPLNTAEVVAVGLDKGQIDHTYRSRRAVVPGNLVCSDGKIISQRAGSVEQFFQLDVLRNQVAKTLAAKPDDAEALAQRGEILWDEGKLAEAVDSLRHSFQISPTANARVLLRDALLEGLRSDFAHYRQAGEEIRRLLDEPRQQAAYLRLMAEGYDSAKEFHPALEQYLKLIELDENRREMETLDKLHAVRRDRWIRIRLAELRGRATAEVRDEIDRMTKSRFEAASRADTIDEWQKFLDYFGAQPSADEARVRLVTKLREAHRLLPTEVVLRQLERSPDRKRAGWALAELAAMLGETKLHDDAAVCYARLRTQYADVVCRDGKTGLQLADALSAEDPVRKAMAPPAPWPQGAIEVQPPSQSRLTEMVSYSDAVPYQDGRGPFFAEMNLEFHHSPSLLRAVDGWGKRRWDVPVNELFGQESIPFGSNLLRATGRDHWLLITAGSKLVALDTLAAADRGIPKVLWSQDIDSPTRAAGGRRGRMGARIIRVAPMRVISPFSTSEWSTSAPVVSISEDLLCFQRSQMLHAVDPATGEVLWTRDDVKPDSAVFGDAQYVFVLPPDKRNATILRAADGEALGTTLPLPHNRLAIVGRTIASWRLDGGQMVLELIDAFDGHAVWPGLRFAPDAKAYADDNQGVGVFESKGHFTLVNLADGRKLIDHAMPPEEMIADLYINRSAERTLVAAIGMERSAPGQQAFRLPGVLALSVPRAKIYAFDAQGKPFWKEPVTVRNQFLLRNQPPRLPALIFGCGVQEQRANAMLQPRVAIVAVDKRTGQVAQAKERFDGAAYFHLEGNPEKKNIDIRLQRQTISLNFTDKPIPAKPQAPPKSSTAKPLSALMNALRRATGLPWLGQSEEEDSQ